MRKSYTNPALNPTWELRVKETKSQREESGRGEGKVKLEEGKVKFEEGKEKFEEGKF